MGFFKKLFGLEKAEESIKEQEETLEEVQPVVSEQPKPIQQAVKKEYPFCEYCKEVCDDERAIVHELGKIFHKRCARKLRKQAKKFVAGNL